MRICLFQVYICIWKIYPQCLNPRHNLINLVVKDNKEGEEEKEGGGGEEEDEDSPLASRQKSQVT